MNCDEVNGLLDAYADGELDIERTIAVERHRETCPGCDAIARSNRALKSALRSDSLYYAVPASLESRIRQALPPESDSRESLSGSGASRSPLGNGWRWGWGAITAALMFGAFATGNLVHPLTGGPSSTPDNPLIQAALTSHIRSLQADHLMDVISTDRHTVKPWFSGKLDFSPDVEDLKDKGFPLVGGRLDTLTGRPIAALVYKRSKHIINVFVCPTSTAPKVGPADITRNGYHLITWTAADMTYCAVSDVNEAELQDFVALLQAQMKGNVVREGS